jgi:hypothetical protein
MNVIDKLVPPGDPSAIHKWRWFVAIGVVVSLMANAAIFSYILGTLPGAGKGFATMEEFNDLKNQQKRMYVNDLTQRLNNTRITQCEAVIEGNQSAMIFTYNRLSMLLDEFRVAAGYDYNVPECFELVPEIRRNIPTPTPPASLAR